VTDPASCSADTAQTLSALPLEQLRAHRRELLLECARATRWRRLLQARLDLAVDALSPAEELDGRLAARACAPASLHDLVHGEPRTGPTPAAGGDPVDQLHDVQHAQRSLVRYTEDLRRELTATTDELVGRYTDDPTRCLVAVGAAPGR
jgi:hypothetical protein